ncbi:hypothetical protein RND71_022247 [Anisodus tanguticus]|uniref:Uncharacterized protein n=1 Tax=Anisodus tanguticus TaxID=243964 RepID=A0AAE1RZP9_9SOLA|nr:hypothetical protein RND71_022247 [Anisodus tanguticus]
MAMLSTKKLIKMARRWKKFAAMQRKRVSFPRNRCDIDSCSTSSSSIVEKGHFVVYTIDQRRFMIPLAYLENEVIGQLFNMSEEEFGLPSGGPITLPCDSAFMDYIVSLIKKGVAAGDLHKALLLSIPSILQEKMAMLSAKKLIKMARRWQKFAAMQRKRISFPRNGSDADSCSSSSSSIVEKGHFVVYTVDQARFIIPLAYLDNEVIQQLLKMSEEEFGLTSGGPITLPCDSAFMDYVVSLIKKGVAAADLHKALLLNNGNAQHQETHQDGQEMEEVCSQEEEEGFVSKKSL